MPHATSIAMFVWSALLDVAWSSEFISSLLQGMPARRVAEALGYIGPEAIVGRGNCCLLVDWHDDGEHFFRMLFLLMLEESAGTMQAVQRCIAVNICFPFHTSDVI